MARQKSKEPNDGAENPAIELTNQAASAAKDSKVQVSPHTRRKPGAKPDEDAKPAPEPMIKLTADAFDVEDEDTREVEEETVRETPDKPKVEDQPVTHQHTAALLRTARFYQIANPERMTREQLRAEIEDARLEEETADREDARRQKQAAAQAKAAEKPAPEEEDLGEYEDEDGSKKKIADYLRTDLHPALRSLLKKQAEENKKLRGEVEGAKKQAEQDKANAAFGRKIDKAFAGMGKEWEPIFGVGPMEELQESGNLDAAFRREQILGLAAQLNQQSGNKLTLEDALAQAAQRSFGFAVQKPAPKAAAEEEEVEKPAPKAKAKEEPAKKNGKVEAEQERWNKGGVALPVDRKPGKGSETQKVLNRIAEREADEGVDLENPFKEFGFPE